MADFNEETIRELNDSIRELTDVMQSSMGITGSSINTQKTFNKAMGEAAVSSSALNVKNKELTQTTHNVSSANKVAAAAAYKVGESFGTLFEATKQSKDALLSFGKSMVDTTDSFSKYSAALNQASGALSTGLSAFGPIGRLLGTLLKPLTMIVDSLLGFEDRLFSAKDELSKFGAVGRYTKDELLEMGKASNFTSHNLEKYAKIVSSTGIGLVGLGGTVNEGVKAFSKLTVITTEEQARFRSMGISMEDFVQNTADFVKLQTMSGRMITDQMKSSGALQRVAKEYTENLVVLAALSGEDVNAQKQKQMQLAMEHEAQIADLATTNKIRQLMLGTEADRAEAAKLQKKMNLETSIRDLTASTLGMDAAKALQHYLKTGVITPETLKVMRNTEMSLEELREAIAAGKDVSAKFVTGLAKADLQLVESQKLALQLNKEYASGMGINQERVAKLAALQGRTVEEVVEQIKKDIASKKVQNAEDEKVRAKRIEDEQETRKNLDDISSKLVKALYPIIDDLSGLMVKLTKSLKDFNFEKFSQDIKQFYENVKTGFSQLMESAKSMFDTIKTNFDEFVGYLKIAATGLAALAATSLISAKSQGGGGLFGNVMDSIKGAGKGVLKGGASVAKRLGAAGALYGAYEAGQAVGEGINWGSEKIFGKSLSEMLGEAAFNMFGPKEVGTSSSTTPRGSEQALLDLIASKESKGDYNILVGGKRANLTGMKVSDVLQFQREMPRMGFESTAVGKYQIIRSTLLETMAKAGVSMDDLFNESTQDKLGKALLEKRGLKAYLDKKITADQFADNLSMEWAALPYNTGKSYYDKVGSNKSLISREQLIQALPKARLGGSFSGPNSGYPVMLHGMETVVPTPNPNTTLLKVEGDSAADKITSALSGMNSDALRSVMEQMYQMMDERLSEMVDKLSTSNDLQDKLLKVQM